jgi:hypothetical protein
LSSTVGRRGPLPPSSCSCRASRMWVTSNTQLLVGWRVVPWGAALLAAHSGKEGRWSLVSRGGAPAACGQQGAASSTRRRAAWSGWCACVMHSISSWPESETQRAEVIITEVCCSLILAGCSFQEKSLQFERAEHHIDFGQTLERLNHRQRSSETKQPSATTESCMQIIIDD